jgi:LPXTG-motif cell wall-anchored protein
VGTLPLLQLQHSHQPKGFNMNTQYAPDYPTPTTTVVTVPTTGYNELPETGTDTHPQLFLGVVLIVFGAIAILVARRNPRR